MSGRGFVSAKLKLLSVEAYLSSNHDEWTRDEVLDVWQRLGEMRDTLILSRIHKMDPIQTEPEPEPEAEPEKMWRVVSVELVKEDRLFVMNIAVEEEGGFQSAELSFVHDSWCELRPVYHEATDARVDDSDVQIYREVGDVRFDHGQPCHYQRSTFAATVSGS